MPLKDKILKYSLTHAMVHFEGTCFENLSTRVSACTFKCFTLQSTVAAVFIFEDIA